MVNEDVLAALESGQLAGAVLDVFPQEPLPAGDPLWRHPQVVITPHMASAASAEVIARQLLENIQRQRAAAAEKLRSISTPVTDPRLYRRCYA